MTRKNWNQPAADALMAKFRRKEEIKKLMEEISKQLPQCGTDNKKHRVLMFERAKLQAELISL
jgi:hypothetical protein